MSSSYSIMCPPHTPVPLVISWGEMTGCCLGKGYPIKAQSCSLPRLSGLLVWGPTATLYVNYSGAIGAAQSEALGQRPIPRSSQKASYIPLSLPSSTSPPVVYTRISKAIFNHLGSGGLKHNKTLYFGQYFMSQNLSLASVLQQPEGTAERGLLLSTLPTHLPDLVSYLKEQHH